MSWTTASAPPAAPAAPGPSLPSLSAAQAGCHLVEPLAVALPGAWDGLAEALKRRAAPVVVMAEPTVQALLDPLVPAAVRGEHRAGVRALEQAVRAIGARVGAAGLPAELPEIGELGRLLLGVAVAAGVRPPMYRKIRQIAARLLARVGAAALTARGVATRLVDTDEPPGRGVVDLHAGSPDAEEGPVSLALRLAGAEAAPAVAVWAAAGLATADPGTLRSARPLAELSLAEVRGLAGLVAGWTGPGRPLGWLEGSDPGQLVEAGRDWLVVGPEHQTLLSAGAAPSPGAARLVVERPGVRVIGVDTGARPAGGALGEIVRALDEVGLPVLHVVASPQLVTVVVPALDDEEGTGALLAELKAQGRVFRVDGLSAVSVVGGGLRGGVHPLGPALESAGSPRIRLLALGIDGASLTVVVEAAVAETLVRALHGRMV